MQNKNLTNKSNHQQTALAIVRMSHDLKHWHPRTCRAPCMIIFFRPQRQVVYKRWQCTSADDACLACAGLLQESHTVPCAHSLSHTCLLARSTNQRPACPRKTWLSLHRALPGRTCSVTWSTSCNTIHSIKSRSVQDKTMCRCFPCWACQDFSLSK